MSEKFYDKFTEKKNSKSGKKQFSKNGTSRKDSAKKNYSQTKENKPAGKSEYAQGKNNSNKKDFSKTKEFALLNAQFSVKNIPADSQYILTNFDDIVQGVRPLNSKQLQQLPDNIKALSHQLTDQRSERRLGYMNENVQLSAYVRYYTWWNLVRLTRLFSNLPESAFPKKDGICLDLGSGPLTVITALWLAKPELRKLKLTWYCLDVSANSMALGEDVYLSVASRADDCEPWNIIRVKGSFGTQIKQKAGFITCANMFNELDQASDMPPEFQSKRYYDQLKVYGESDTKYLLIEPGVPKATRTLALLRERFIREGNTIVGPCPHNGECPMNGFKAYTGSQNKWCNFAFATEDAPARLLKLSEKAKLPKERATLIFISATKEKIESAQNDDLTLRITSDSFRLPEYKTGYYACSKLGLTLVRVNKRFDSENIQNNNILHSGDLISVKIKTPDLNNLKKDEKSGAVVIEL